MGIFETRRTATSRRAPPLGCFITKMELETLRALLRGDLSSHRGALASILSADNMLASILRRRPRLQTKADVGQP